MSEEKVLGKEHPDALICKEHLAEALRDRGKYVEAEKRYRETLALREKAVGRDYSDTLISCIQSSRGAEETGEARGR